MNLLTTNADGTLGLRSFPGDALVPIYAILSHTWEPGDHEVTFQDLTKAEENSDEYGKIQRKRGYTKIQFCAEQAAKDGLPYFWVDSCCVDQKSSRDVSEAINKMFRYYENATKCYVYHSDVSIGTPSKATATPWLSAFKNCRWFTRGWTLQELLAPQVVEFFSREWERLGNKESLEEHIHKITRIPIAALQGRPLSEFGIDERMSWAENRYTTIEEDQAYCLFGLFDLHMALIYGEGKANALDRLRKKIDKVHGQNQRTLSWNDRELVVNSYRTTDERTKQMHADSAYIGLRAIQGPKSGAARRDLRMDPPAREFPQLARQQLCLPALGDRRSRMRQVGVV